MSVEANCINPNKEIFKIIGKTCKVCQFFVKIENRFGRIQYVNANL